MPRAHYRVYIEVYIGIMEKNMETTIVYWGYIGYRGYNIGVTACRGPPASPSSVTPFRGRLGFGVWGLGFRV